MFSGCKLSFYIPATDREGEYCFWCRSRCFLMHSISWTNGWSLTKLAYTHYWEGRKKWLDIGDLDIIFKVTPALWIFKFWPKKAFLHPVSWTGQTSYIVTLEWFKDFIRFWWLWPNFQGHHTIKTIRMSLVRTLSPEPHFQGHTRTLNVKFWPKMLVCVYSGLTLLSTIFQSYHDGVWLRQGAQCSLL